MRRLLHLPNIWKSHMIPVEIKRRLLETLVWPIATYGSEAWTMSKVDEQRIEAFEMKTLRRMLQVHWSTHTTNDAVLERAGTQRKLLHSIKKRRLRYIGHTLRRPSALQAIIATGMIPGTNRRGRPRTTWHDNTKTWTGLTLTEQIRTAADRSSWSDVVMSVAQGLF